MQRARRRVLLLQILLSFLLLQEGGARTAWSLSHHQPPNKSSALAYQPLFSFFRRGDAAAHFTEKRSRRRRKQQHPSKSSTGGSSNKKRNTSRKDDSGGSGDGGLRIVVLPAWWARLWYIVTALNPALAVIFNDYAKMVGVMYKPPKQHYLAKTYETIFFFARLKPRVSFAIGAILRALHLTTALQYAFDPTAGVGFGLNIICLFAHSRWPAVGVLGWSATKQMWKLLGARPPRGLSVPITISMRKEKDPEVVTRGYRLGL